MFGLTSVNNLKSSILFDEFKSLAARIRTFRPKLSSVIDLEEPVRSLQVTLDEPDFENAPTDFGSFNTTEADSIILPVNNYFIVRTPQSTPERWPEREDSIDSITMQEDLLALPEELDNRYILNRWLMDYPWQYPVAAGRGELLEPILEEPDEIIPINSVVAPHDEEIVQGQAVPLPSNCEPWQPVIREQENQNLRSAQIQSVVSDVEKTNEQNVYMISSASPSSSRPSDQDQRRALQRSSTLESFVLGVVPSRGRGKGRKRKNLTRDKEVPIPVLGHNRDNSDTPLRPLRSSTSESFVLKPTPSRGRSRGRRKRPSIDRVIEIPMPVLQHNMDTSDKLVLESLDLPFTGDTPQGLFSKFGLRSLANGNRRFWRNLQTLHEPDDPSAFGYFKEH